MDKAQKLRLVKDFNMSRSQKERLIKITNSEDSNNDFDFKVYINGHEDLIQEEAYIDVDVTTSINVYGDVATDILNNINPLIFNILNNKLYIEFESADNGFDVYIRKEDNRGTSYGSTTLSIETDYDTEEPKPVVVVGMFFINPEEDEKYLKASDIIALCILRALEKIDANHLINALNKYSN